MQNINIERLNNLCRDFIQIISDVCDSQPSKVLSFGNAELKVMTNSYGLRVPFIKTNENSWVELYSENGYLNISDIAHWADVCQDVANSRKAGYDRYSVTWNMK